MKTKIFPTFLTIIFLIIFVIFYKGLKNSNIYIPKVNIEKDILDLDKTLTWTNTIRNNAENIETSTVRIKKNILAQLENLNDQIEKLKVNQ